MHAIKQETRLLPKGEICFLKRAVPHGGKDVKFFYGPLVPTTSSKSWRISKYYANLLERRVFARGDVTGIIITKEGSWISIRTDPFATVWTLPRLWTRATEREFFMHLARSPFRVRAYRTFARALRRHWTRRRKAAYRALCMVRIPRAVFYCMHQSVTGVGAIRIRLQCFADLR